MAQAENNVASVVEARVQRQPQPNPRNQPNLGLLEANDNYGQLLEQAVALTRGIPIGDMHWQDRDTLNKTLHERPQLLTTSSRFHYARMASLFEVPRVEIRVMENAEQVLNYISQTQEVEITVAEFLTKLNNYGQCFDVVRQLANQIIQRDREQH